MAFYKRWKGKKKDDTLMYPFIDKDECMINYDLMTLNMLIHMFKWEGLPETIPDFNLELILLIYGHAVINKADGDLYAFYGGLGSRPDEYYFPTQTYVNNPYLNFNKIGTIGKDSVVVRNDTLIQGVMPILHRYHSQMVENDITQHLANINMRLMNVLTASDDDDKAECDRFINDIISGKLSSIQANGFIEGVHTQPYGSSGNGNQVTQLIEYAQWLRGRLLQEFGITGVNTNIKREYVSDTEINSYNNPNTALINDFLICRRRGAEEINKMFGTEITVDYSDEWKKFINFDNELTNPETADEEIRIDETPEEIESENEPVETETTEPETEPEETETEPETADEIIEEVIDQVEEIIEDAKEEIIEEIEGGEDNDSES